jgi:UDP-3-O-[3-hydroxymyristoyl] glucosamine N-acyltransferase
MPAFSAGELARMVDGRLVGRADTTVDGVAAIESAQPSDLAFLRDTRRLEPAENCRAGVLITSVELKRFGGTMIVCPDVDMAMATVLAAVAEGLPRPRGVSKLASVSPSATLGQDVSVGDFAVIGDGAVLGDGVVIYPLAYVGRNCRIGDRTVLHASVSVHEGVTIGKDCIVHYNAVLGAEGFGFLQRDGRNVKVCQVGTVRVGDRVEIGSLTTVDRATLDATVIEDGVKIDNHCHVAHNCHIGPDCIMAGYSKLAGSVRLGKGVILAEDVGISDHVTVGDGAILGASCGVHNNVPAGAVLLGAPARPIAEQRRIFALTGRLPEMAERLRRLEAEVESLRRLLESKP